MFIFENYFKNRERKIREWKCARDKWVNEESDIYYRTERDYERHHPYPVFTIGSDSFWGWTIGVFFVVAIGGTLINVLAPDDKPESSKPTASQSQKQITEYKGIKVGDHVQIDYGDYEDKTGRVLSINDNHRFRIRLDNGQTITDVESDGDKHTRTIPNGLEITVETHNNLNVIQ